MYIDLLEMQFLPKKREKPTKLQKSIKPDFLSKSIILPNDFFSRNYINIIKEIKKIQDYETIYWIPERVESIQQQHQYQEIQQVQETNLILFTYQKPKHKPMIPFSIFLRKQHPKRLLYHLQHSYKKILSHFQELAQKQIYYFYFSSQNLLFSERTHDPILQHFHLAFRTSEPNLSKQINRLLDGIQNYSSQPLEVHVLFFLYKNNFETLSYSQIEEISHSYTKKMPIFSLFSDSDREKYRESCVRTLNRYINMPLTEIQHHIFSETGPTWELFSLSILYLRLVEKMNRVFSLKDTFFNAWAQQLIQMLDPDSSKRLQQDPITNFQSLYEDYTDWKFVKTITSEEHREKWIEILQ